MIQNRDDPPGKIVLGPDDVPKSIFRYMKDTGTFVPLRGSSITHAVIEDPRWSRAKMGQPSNGFRKPEEMPEVVAHVRGEGKVCQSLESHLYGVGRFLQG